ncbi:MAG: hypothetical protein J6R85_03350 [Lentisphaeria bacterium]|nr:hypothetical protein [Lentisphaeria bacterium]
MKWNDIAADFAQAWSLVLDWKLPEWFRKQTEHAGSAGLILPMIPLAGLPAVMALLIVYGAIAPWVTHFGSALLFAAGALLLLESKDSGRGIGLLTSVLVLKISGRNTKESLPYLQPLNYNNLPGGIGPVLLGALLFFKFSALFYLAWVGHPGYLAAILLLGLTVQGALLQLDDLDRGVPWLTTEPGMDKLLWAAGIFPVLFLLPAMAAATVAAVGIAFLTAFLAGRSFQDNPGGATSEMITLTGAASEILLCLTGILLVK